MSLHTQLPQFINSENGSTLPATLGAIARQLTRIADALEALATVKEEKGKIPHTPLKEKGESNNNNSRSRAREKFVKPTVEEVAKYIRDNGYTFDPEAFWNFYESKGWRVGNHVMKSWTSACVTWQKRTDAEKKREAELTAHIDARADEREVRGLISITMILSDTGS